MGAKSEMMIFDSEIMFFELDLEEVTSYEQFWETNNCLCKVSTA